MKCRELLGKTIADVAAEHNIEYSLQEACDWGILIELYISHIIFKLPAATIRSWQYQLKEQYGEIELECQWYDKIWACISNKNIDSCILEIPNLDGEYVKTEIYKSQVIEAFDFCREGF